MVARLLIAVAVFGLTGCPLAERDDFLLGRVCRLDLSGDCDPGQTCLPHAFDDENQPQDFRCRDGTSLRRGTDNRDPPLAYCDGRTWVCPAGTVCQPDRIRVAVGRGVRRRVCTPEGSPFGPP